MMQKSEIPIYLDHNATTQPDEAVIEAVAGVMREGWANPSSVHRAGQDARHRVELARESAARLIGAEPGEIVFTASGTESCNLAVFGTVRRLTAGRKVIITTGVEHSAVREPVEVLEKAGTHRVVRLSVDREGSRGVVDMEEFEGVLREHGEEVGLITVQWANNETGVIQPLEEMVKVSRRLAPRAVFHTDGIQWVGKMGTDVRALGADLVSFAGHKFHGPGGAAGLYVRKGVRVTPMVVGGPHERSRRAGTENTAAIVGFGVACERARERIERGGNETEREVRGLRDGFEALVLREIPGAVVNGAGARYGRLSNTSNIAFERLEAEAILLLLSERGVYASAGAACSSGSLEPSPVLLAMGIPAALAHGSIRFSLAHTTRREELEEAAAILKETIGRLRRTLAVGSGRGA